MRYQRRRPAISLIFLALNSFQPNRLPAQHSAVLDLQELTPKSGLRSFYSVHLQQHFAGFTVDSLATFSTLGQLASHLLTGRGVSSRTVHLSRMRRREEESSSPEASSRPYPKTQTCIPAPYRPPTTANFRHTVPARATFPTLSGSFGSSSNISGRTRTSGTFNKPNHSYPWT